MKINRVFHAFALITTVMVAAIGNKVDPSTYANIDEAATSHIDLNFAVDFDRQVFTGKVTHTMNLFKDKVKSVYFDS